MTESPDRTRLHGRWLVVVRLAWVVMALLYTGVFLATLPDRISKPESGNFAFDWTEEEFDTALAESGWSHAPIQNFNLGFGVVLNMVNLALAVFIFWRRTDDWMALWVAALLVWITGSGSFNILAAYQPAWATVGLIGDCISSAMLVIFFFLFPDGRFVPRWTRWAALAVSGVMVWRLFNEPAYMAFASILIAPLFLMMAFAQVYRYARAASPVQRQQIKWVVFGLAGGLTPLFLFLFLLLALPALNRPNATGLFFNFLGYLFWTGFLILLPVSFTLAILRSRLWEIDVIIRKTLAWGLLTALLGLVYFGGVLALQQLFRALTGQESPLAIILSTLAIAALFNPLRRRVQELVDRRFYRRKYNAEQALASFAALARQEVDLEEISTRLLGVVAETVQPEQVSLMLRPAADHRRHGTLAPGDEAWNARRTEVTK